MSLGTLSQWPALPYAEWEPTKQTLHRYTQIVGKIRMALVPFRNHWWHVTLQPVTRGLSTGPMPYRGRPNASYLVPVTMRLMAEVRGEDLGELCAAVDANTEAAFGGSW